MPGVTLATAPRTCALPVGDVYLLTYLLTYTTVHCPEVQLRVFVTAYSYTINTDVRGPTCDVRRPGPGRRNPKAESGEIR